MRTLRNDLFIQPGIHTVLIANRMRAGVPVLTLEDRAMLRGFIETAARAESFELLTWCYLPTSYRIVLRGKLKPPGRIDKHDHSDTQSYPLARLVKSAFVRLGHWRNFRKVESLVWKERFHCTPLPGKAEQLAAALSVDVHPVLHGLVDKAEDYYFCAFHDACAGDETARRGIATLIGTPTAAWPEVRASYRSKLHDLQKRIADAV